MNYENAEDDYAEYGDEEEDDATAVTKQSIKLDHLMNLDDAVSNDELDEESDEEEGVYFM
jgi:hypothetical protein